MNKTFIMLTGIFVLLSAILLSGCPKRVHERIEEGTRLTVLDEMVHARDRALESQVEGNIMSDLTLRWYAQTYGITVEGSHAVMTVSMKVKTEQQRDKALQLAGLDGRIQEVIDNIVIDPQLEDPPFGDF
ncbi:MAG TPA: BON domain-containing protein [Firmicutes bacterium]|nr:BON domain-containing protein [Bacillota bacterium]